MNPINEKEIIDITGLDTKKIRNIYIYGSRVYGTYSADSDYDIMVTACSMFVHKEFYVGQYNIHVVTPDVFEDKLRKHDIHTLECIYAPEFAKIRITNDYGKNFVLNYQQLKKMLLSQSAEAWRKAMMRIEDGNYVGGEKGLFHSLRILKFGIQIIEKGRLFDFSEANSIYDDIQKFVQRENFDFEWASYKRAWHPLRKELQKKLRGIYGEIDPITVKIRNMEAANVSK